MAIIAMLFSFTAANAQPLAENVPADALIYVGWRGASDLGPGYEGSHLQAVLKASNLAELVEDFLPRALGELAEQTRLDVDMLDMLGTILGHAWKYPTALYFGGIEKGPNGRPNVKFALFCKAGNDGPRLARQLNGLFEESGAPVRAAEANGLVTIAMGQLPGGDKLAKSVRFTAAMKEVGSDPVLAVYVDAEGLMTMAESMMDAELGEVEEWRAVRDAMGLTNLKRFALTAGFKEKNWATNIWIEAPGKRHGLLALIDGKPLSDDALKVVPKSAAWVAAVNFDVARFIPEIRRGLQLSGTRAGPRFDDALAELRDTLGFDLQKDLLEAMGDEWIVYSDNNVAGTGMLGMAGINRLRDPKKFEASMKRLQVVAGEVLQREVGRGGGPRFEFKTFRMGGRTVNYLSIPAIAPAWTIEGDMLVVGLYPQVVVAAADRLKAGGPSILENEEYIKLRKSLTTASNPNMIGFFDLPQTAGEGYQTSLLISQFVMGMADMFGLNAPPMVLPTLRDLRPHLVPAGLVTWSDEKGWHLAGSTPFPGAELLATQQSVMVSVQAMAVGVLLPALGSARRNARQMQSSTQVRGLIQGCINYAPGNKDRFPDNIGMLVDLNYFTPEYMFSPMDARGITIPADLMEWEKAKRTAWLNENTSYCYITGQVDDTDSTKVLIFEKLHSPGMTGVAVGFHDNHVNWMTVREASALIKKQTGRTLEEWSEAKNPGAGGK
ncbi:MAG: hypothetical protein WD768_14510 [Phycisphaeraceae bacterium]